MGKLLWSTAICLGLCAWVHCIPVEIVYTGEGCECPTKLGYQINIPKVKRPPSYTPGEYGYKVDVPVPPPGLVSYSFDFTVEEPRPPRPVKHPKWELYAKVDRITAKKEDCESSSYDAYEAPNYGPKPTSYKPAPTSYENPTPQRYGSAPSKYDSYDAAPAPPTCNCGQCGVNKPLYRYVYKKNRPCKCQRPQCKCNLKRKALMNSAKTVKPNKATECSGNNVRRKRDLRRVFQRKRTSAVERPGRFLKMYHKSLPGKRQAHFHIESPFEETTKKSKRKTKKAPMFSLLHSRLKRDIKGEYDLLEKEREQMDLTLPEIIQFMPETLQPNFKRGQCHFGCSAHSAQKFQQIQNQEGDNQESKEQNSQEVSNSNDETSTERNENSDVTPEVMEEQFSQQQEGKDTEDNNIVSVYKKRNAANYYFSNPSSASVSVVPTSQLASFYDTSQHRTYSEPSPPPTPSQYAYRPPSHPIYSPQVPEQNSAYSGYQPFQAQPPQYVYDNLERRYLENDGNLKFMLSTSRVPDPTGADYTPLQFDGDLETPPSLYRTLPLSGAAGANTNIPLVGSARQYPVQHVSNARLDRIISDIVHAHPDFIDVSSHYGGALVDPEPLQKQQTKDFLKKLIDGRLQMWFGDEDDHNSYYSSGSNSRGGYSSQRQNPYSAPPPIVGYLPGYY